MKNRQKWLGGGGASRDRVAISPTAIRGIRANRFANILQQLKVGRNERLFTLSGRVPELYVGGLGTLRNGSVFLRCSRHLLPSRSSNACAGKFPMIVGRL